MRAWLPCLFALAGCAGLTWLDAHSFFFVFPRLPFALALLLPLVPLRWDGLRKPRRLVPLALASLWMVALPFVPTGESKRFALTIATLERGMTPDEVRARMEPFLEIGREHHWSADEAWAYPAPGPEVLVFLSSRASGQVCQVFLGSEGVTRVEWEYVD
ncbi:MAG TPA: hypothetical protein VF530_11555 [Planctomycetota bacterium]